MEVNEANDREALVASIPQMLALLHINGFNLHGMKAKLFKLKDPLRALQGRTVSNRPVQQVVYITEPPKCSGHPPGRVRVRVLYPIDSEWAKEGLLWG